MDEIRHPHLKIKICVSGAVETGHCGVDALEIGKEVGKEIIRQGAILVTGATTGFPMWAAIGAKEEGGISIGISPAQTELEHVEKYKLPLEYMDLIMYTGSGYSGRNLQLTRTSDAVIVGCGRIGTLNEFTIAFEDDKPIGILEGNWTTDELIKKFWTNLIEATARLFLKKTRKKLVEKIVKLVNKEKVQTIKCPGCI